MGITEKIANAEPTTWVTDGLSDTEVAEIVESAKKIAEFKVKANRPGAWDKDVERILRDCGGDVDLAVSLINRR